MENKLNGQIAIITGASSGIGAGCAMELAKAGATVIVNYPAAKSKEKTDRIIDQINASGGKASGYQCDVSKEDEVIRMFADTVKQFGTVDILINNAGCSFTNVFRLTDSFLRNKLEKILHIFFAIPVFFINGSGNCAGRDTVDPDLSRSKLLCNGFHHQHHSAFRRCIIYMSRPRYYFMNAAHADYFTN